MGMGFAAVGDLITSDTTFVRIFPERTLYDVTLGLITRSPGADADDVARKLRAVMPRDVRVMTRTEMLSFEENYWSKTTLIGIIFGFGVAVAFAVGVLVLYQVLSADITRSISEYATLKAIGYRDSQISMVVVQQALWLSVASFVPAFIFALGINKLTRDAAHLPAEMTVTRLAAVFFLTLIMCAGSAWLALQKVRAANPADL